MLPDYLGLRFWYCFDLLGGLLKVLNKQTNENQQNSLTYTV